MAMVETYEEVGEVDCPLCSEPVVRLDEVVVLALGVILHSECFEQATSDQIRTVDAQMVAA